MKILNVDVFDLYGDGTLVFKTNVDTPENKDIRYSWYVKKGDKTIYKGTYGKKPFMAYKIKSPGNYTIKAYALNESMNLKDKVEVEFLANKETSPILLDPSKKDAAADEMASLHAGRPPVVTHVAGRFWHMAADGEYPKGTKFAWYIYTKGNSTAYKRQAYSEEAEYVYKFEEPGEYQIKMSVVNGKKKETSVSGIFTVTA